MENSGKSAERYDRYSRGAFEDILCSDDDSDDKHDNYLDSEHQNWGTAAPSTGTSTANDNLSRIQNFDLDGDLSHLIGKTITAPLGGGGGGELWSSSRRSNRTGNGLGRSTQSLPDTFDGSSAVSDIEPYDYRANTPVGVGGSITDGRSSSPMGGIISLSDSTHLSEILTCDEMWGVDRPSTSDRRKFIKSEKPQRRKTADDLTELMYGDMFSDSNAASSVELRGKFSELQPTASNYVPIGGTKRRKSMTDLAEYSDFFGMDPNFDTESSISGVSAVSGKSAPPTCDPATTFDQSMSKSKRTAAALEALQNCGFDIGTRGCTMKRVHQRETKFRQHASKPTAKRNVHGSRPDGFTAPINNNAPIRKHSHSELTYMSVPMKGPAMTNTNRTATMAAPAMDPLMSGPSMSGSTMGGQFMSGSIMRDQSIQGYGSTTGGPSPSMSGQTQAGSMSGPTMTGSILGPVMFGPTMMGGPSMTASSMPEANSMIAPAMSAPQTNPGVAMTKLHNSMVRTSFSQHLLQEYDRANVSRRFSTHNGVHSHQISGFAQKPFLHYD